MAEHVWTEQLDELINKVIRRYGHAWQVINSNGPGPMKYDLSEHPLINELINELYKAYE